MSIFHQPDLFNRKTNAVVKISSTAHLIFLPNVIKTNRILELYIKDFDEIPMQNYSKAIYSNGIKLIKSLIFLYR